MPRSPSCPRALVTVLAILLWIGAASSATPLEAGHYYLRLRDRCASDGYMTCIRCYSQDWSNQVYAAPARDGRLPQAWQVEHVAQGDADAFVLRPLDPECCSNFLSAQPAGCGPSFVVIEPSDRSKHPAQIYWLAEAATGGVRV
ncbi:hypothetical protein CHLNCDRAFT_142524, partial [Chlorella variabilis]